MYIRDLRHTSGHVSSISCLAWHPTNPNTFLTASSDSTLRIWDKSTRRQSTSVIVVKSKERGGKTKVSSCCWSKDGKLIAAASEDGSIMVWKTSGNFTRPDYVRIPCPLPVFFSLSPSRRRSTCISTFRDGRQTTKHTTRVRSRVQSFSAKTENTSRRAGATVRSNVSGRLSVSFILLPTLKIPPLVWNPKSLKKPLSVLDSLPSLNSETSLAFSPDGKYLLTGTAGSKAGVLPGNAEEAKAAELERELGQRMGEVVVIAVDADKGELEIKDRIEISEFSVVKVLWHERINQVRPFFFPFFSLLADRTNSTVLFFRLSVRLRLARFMSSTLQSFRRKALCSV